MQIISRFVPRTWVSVMAADTEHDVAVLRAPGLRPPAVMHLASVAPTSGKLFVLGYPASASLTVPAETWAVMENDKFPANIGPLANPRDLLWMSAPEVAHGYSGGPMFDPRSGAVVGMIKGQVDGGYLRLVRGMPTTGIAIGPGVGSIGDLVRHEVPYAAVSLGVLAGRGGRGRVAPRHRARAVLALSGPRVLDATRLRPEGVVPIRPAARRGAGVVDRDGLENRCTLTGTEGSNPSLSARYRGFRNFSGLN